MLADDDQALKTDPISEMIAQLNGNSSSARRLSRGIYEVGHFNMGNIIKGYNQYPDINPGPYGVCDSVANLIEKCPELQNPKRQFLVSVTSIKKSAQSSDGGWRWHKWGEYIGKYDPQHEYLYDEEGIEEVFVFHIFEKE